MARTTRKSKGTGKGNSVEAARRRAGRPVLGEEVYDISMCDVVIEMGKRGSSETSMAVNGCKVARSTMRAWADRHPEFKYALALARDHAKAWWEDTGNIRLRTIGFNTHLYNKIISCRFREDYSERMVVEGDADKPLVHKIERIIVKASKRTRKSVEQDA